MAAGLGGSLNQVTPRTSMAPQPYVVSASPAARAVTAPRRTPKFPLLGHAPGLDGLRGVAVIIVVIFHFVGKQFFNGGWAGVDIFFGLSGFLITALILDELRVHGRVRLGRFYARRACRLLPALLFLLSVWVLVLLAFHDQTWMGATPSGDGTGRTIDVGGAMSDLAIALVYVANWNVIDGGMEAPLAHLWSLAVEEQFYLVWPLLLLAVVTLRRRLRLAVVLGLMAVSASLPFLFWNGGEGQDRIYFGTDTRAVGLLAGSFAAMVWHERHAQGRSARLGGLRAWAALAVIVYIVWYSIDSELKFLVFPALLALVVSQIVPALADRRAVLTPLFSQRWLVWAGKRSYGLYLWHYVWATWTHPLGLWPGVPLGVAAALVCTQISWLLVEVPAVRFGRRFAVEPNPARQRPVQALRASA